MAKTIREIMTDMPLTMSADDSAADAARAMQEHDIGDVLVEDGGKLCGIATDRDIVVRVVANGEDPTQVKLRDMCSGTLTTVTPDTPVEKVMETMKQNAIRRVPVVKDGKAVGIVSLGDLAVERDRKSVLGEISAAAATM